MTRQTTRYYLYMGKPVRVFIDEDGDPDTADVYNTETGAFVAEPVLALDSQTGASGFVEISEDQFNAKLAELKQGATAG